MGNARWDFMRLFNRLSRVEGCRKRPYRDSKGILTIGVGHNMEASPLPDDMPLPLSEDNIKDIFALDVRRAVEALDAHVSWWRRLDAVRQEVMIELMFNMGWGNYKRGLSSFHRTLEDIRAGRYKEAARNLSISKWANDVKHYRASTLCAALTQGVWLDVAPAS